MIICHEGKNKLHDNNFIKFQRGQMEAKSPEVLYYPEREKKITGNIRLWNIKIHAVIFSITTERGIKNYNHHVSRGEIQNTKICIK